MERRLQRRVLLFYSQAGVLESTRTCVHVCVNASAFIPKIKARSPSSNLMEHKHSSAAVCAAQRDNNHYLHACKTSNFCTRSTKSLTLRSLLTRGICLLGTPGERDFILMAIRQEWLGQIMACLALWTKSSRIWEREGGEQQTEHFGLLCPTCVILMLKLTSLLSWLHSNVTINLALA